MGAFTGACLVAMAVGAVASKLGAPAGIVGAALGFAGGLWLVLWRDSRWGAGAVVGLTGIAIVLVVCLGYVAFD